MAPDDHKFQELLIFVCQRSEGDKPFGAVKLNKLLFYSDFFAFRKFGKSITGHRYQKLKNGPAPRALLPIVDELKTRGDIAVAERDYYGHTQHRTLALRDAILAAFAPEEVALVTEIIEQFWGKSARDMSELSHRFRGWRRAAINEDIPYEVATVRFIRNAPPEVSHLSSEQVADIKSLASHAI